MSQKSDQSHDPRVRRTRRWLQEAFLALVLEKGFEQVTVNDITARAGVNRATFYKHYLDKWDLLTSWVDEMHLLLEEQAVTLHDPRFELPGHVPDLVVNVLKHVAQHADFYRLMIGKNGILLIENELQRVFEEFSRQQLLMAGPPYLPESIPLPIVCRSYAASFVGVLKWWLENDMPYPAEQMAAWLWETPTVVGEERHSAGITS